MHALLMRGRGSGGGSATRLVGDATGQTRVWPCAVPHSVRAEMEIARRWRSRRDGLNGRWRLRRDGLREIGDVLHGASTIARKDEHLHLARRSLGVSSRHVATSWGARPFSKCGPARTAGHRAKRVTRSGHAVGKLAPRSVATHAWLIILRCPTCRVVQNRKSRTVYDHGGEVASLWRYCRKATVVYCTTVYPRKAQTQAPQTAHETTTSR